jgi:hypothetical protein
MSYFRMSISPRAIPVLFEDLEASKQSLLRAKCTKSVIGMARMSDFSRLDRTMLECSMEL